MVPKHDARSLIKSRFPDHALLIDRACGEHATFRELCQDYRQCALALERWRRLSDDELSPRVQEYAGLLADLTQELESWLGAMQNGVAQQRRGGPR